MAKQPPMLMLTRQSLQRVNRSVKQQERTRPPSTAKKRRDRPETPQFWMELTSEGSGADAGWYSWKLIYPDPTVADEWKDASPAVTGTLNARDANLTRGLTGRRVLATFNGLDDADLAVYLFDTNNLTLFQDGTEILEHVAEIDVINQFPTTEGVRFDFGDRDLGLVLDTHIVKPAGSDDYLRLKLPWTGYDVGAVDSDTVPGTRLLYFTVIGDGSDKCNNVKFTVTDGDPNTALVTARGTLAAYACHPTNAAGTYLNQVQAIKAEPGVTVTVIPASVGGGGECIPAKAAIGLNLTTDDTIEIGQEGSGSCNLLVRHGAIGAGGSGPTVTFEGNCLTVSDTLTFDALGHYSGGTQTITFTIPTTTVDVPTAWEQDPDTCEITATDFVTVTVLAC